MLRIQHFRTASAALAAAAILIAASPVSAASGTDDTGARLEAAKVMLERSAGVLSANQMSALSHTLRDALESTHYGFQTSALRLMIQYGDQVKFNHHTIIEVVRLYRDHSDDRVRRMAVVALGAVGDKWGLDFLKRSLPYETVAPVRHTVAAVVAEHSS